MKTPVLPQVQTPPLPASPPGAAPSASQASQPSLEGVVVTPTVGLNLLNLSALHSRRSDLTTQLASVTSRRSELARDLRRTNSLAQEGVLQHIKQLDTRIIQIESDIAANSNAILLKNATETQSPHNFDFGAPGPFSQGGMIPISIVFTLFVLCPLALSISRLLWKRGNRAPAPVASRDSELRMERVEQAVDAIAVEIERISEGQRFVTALLSKPAPNALNVAQTPADPVRIPIAAGDMAAVSRVRVG